MSRHLPPRLTTARLALAALTRRKARVGLALVALGLGATLLTALLTLYAGVRRDLSGEFRRFGANIVVTAGGGGVLLPAAAPARAARVLGPGVKVAGLLVEVARVTAAPARPALAPGGARAAELVVVGADWDALRRLNPTWTVAPASPAALRAGGAWIGARAARALALPAVGTITARLRGRAHTWPIAGTVASGAAEDNQIFVPLADLQALADEPGISTLEAGVSGGPEAITAALAALRRALPGAVVSPVRPIAATEGRILLRTHALLVATTLLILLTLGLGLAAALASAALERRREFGLMRALGARVAGVFALFALEALALGLAAALAGFVLGGGIAAGIAAAVFGVPLAPGARIFAVTLLATLALAALAALVPWPVVRRAAPATILKGE
ncbi:MAG TPA: FtsX-like permease family protein [Terriglobales bacterium]|nr:FtsX-like permease family protein [Terriglobales bacterium]